MIVSSHLFVLQYLCHVLVLFLILLGGILAQDCEYDIDCDGEKICERGGLRKFCTSSSVAGRSGPQKTCSLPAYFQCLSFLGIYSTCDNQQSICVCQSGYKIGGSGKCVKKLGYPCIVEDECDTSRQAKCSSVAPSTYRICSCPPDLIPVGEKCLSRTVKLGRSCEHKTQCSNFGEFAECKIHSSSFGRNYGSCQCKIGYSEYKDKCYQSQRHNWNCESDEECLAGTGENSACLRPAYKCGCKTDEYIYSPKEGKCVTLKSLGLIPTTTATTHIPRPSTTMSGEIKNVESIVIKPETTIAFIPTFPTTILLRTSTRSPQLNTRVPKTNSTATAGTAGRDKIISEGTEASSTARNTENRTISPLPPEDNTTVVVIIVIISILIIALLGIPFGIFYFFRRRRKQQEKRAIEDGHGREKGEAEEPLLQSFEVQEKNFTINKNEVLGKGKTGIVYRGYFKKQKVAVAIKTNQVQLLSTDNYSASIVEEAKILIYLGPHKNIVQLYGTCLKSLSGQGNIYLLCELCPLGSLESFLHRNRERFPFYNFSEEAKFHQNRVDGEDKLEIGLLLKWAVQIAEGMEFIATKKVVHRDLATRNILLSTLETIKITDFGMSKRFIIEEYHYFKPSKDERLPWRWLDYDALQLGYFTTYTDVWSFAITLFEIFSLGGLPYPTIAGPNEKFLNDLKNGIIRPTKPEYATDELYDLMQMCWIEFHNDRPGFTLLKQKLTAMVQAQNAAVVSEVGIHS